MTDPPGSSAEPALCERAAGPAGRRGWHRMNADWQRLLCTFAVLRRRIVQTLTHWARSRRSLAGHASCCRRRSLRSPLACLVQKHSCARGAGHGRTDDSASPKQRTRAGTQTRHPEQAPRPGTRKNGTRGPMRALDREDSPAVPSPARHAHWASMASSRARIRSSISIAIEARKLP